MASRTNGAAQASRPGQLLVVVHEFVARSADELSLKKGDRIELIERDDDFGDGWYLGRHEQNGHTGLFPEVYTRPLPASSVASKQSKGASPPSIARSAELAAATNKSAPTSPAVAKSSPPFQRQDPMSAMTSSPTETDSAAGFVSPGVSAASTYPLMSPKGANAASRSPVQQSTVMNETLNVINEHITDMRRPSSGSGKVKEKRSGNDSASEYSVQAESQHSYIQGHETDEEESNALTEEEVASWSPERVAEYLDDAGVEKLHSQIFLEQEISGDVLLGMDQSSLFLKEFELGSVGRRMRTWQKVKALQEAVRGAGSTPTNKIRSISQTSSYVDDNSATNGSMIPRMSQLIKPSGSGVVDHLAQRLNAQVYPGSLSGSASGSATMINSSSGPGSTRPSAASIRSLGHARRHSSMDMANSTAHSRGISTHSKQPSLDQTWTMSGVPSQGNLAPKGTGAHMQSMSTDRHQFDKPSRDPGLKVITTPDPDRGYVSSGETDSRKGKRVLTKRTGSENPHQRHSSYGTDRRRISDAFKRNSTSGSPSSEAIASGAPQSAAAKLYYNITNKTKSPRAVSAPTMEKDAVDPSPDPDAPTVTRLEYGNENGTPTVIATDTSPSELQTPSTIDGQNDTQTSPRIERSSTARKSIRAISDAVTGRERAAATSPTDQNFTQKRVAIESPTGTSTPSAASRSLEMDQSAAPPPPIGLTPIPPSARRTTKSKKATSAYTRGLEKKTPQEQMVDCDYSGWMKKKSSNLMTTWKPRLFVLRGRRLSYYYSENDTEEKGLIDISSHRVLPADNDRITGIHATLTGAGNSPSSPAMSSPASPTNPNAPSTNTSTSPLVNFTGNRSRATSSSSGTAATSNTAGGGSQNAKEGIFIFKLVPPRSGLSRAVNFTKPTVHYFAVNSLQEGRLWMAAFMKATIDRDESKEVVTTYQHKTISLAKARARRELPPFLGGVDEVDGEGDEDDDGESENKESTRGRNSTLAANGEFEGVPLRSSSELRRYMTNGGDDALDGTTENSSVKRYDAADTTSLGTGEGLDESKDNSVIVNEPSPGIERETPREGDGLGIHNLSAEGGSTGPPSEAHEPAPRDSGNLDDMAAALGRPAATMDLNPYSQPA